VTTDAKVQIGNSADFLEGTSVTTPAGTNLFREGVVISDPELPGARAEVRQIGTALTDMDWGLVTHSIIQGRTTGGGGSLVDVKVTPSGALTVEADVVGTVAISGTVQIAEPVTVEGTVALDAATLAALETVNVGNFPAVQPVSATDLDIRNLSSAQDSVTVTGSVNVGNFPATQAVSGTVTANLGTLNGAATAANQTTGNTSLSSIDGKLPDLSGTWGYNAGTSGTVMVAANKRVLAITATAAPLLAASMTINGGQTITIPAGTSITIQPRANLTAPTLVFTSTSAYFVEFIE